MIKRKDELQLVLFQFFDKNSGDIIDLIFLSIFLYHKNIITYHV